MFLLGQSSRLVPDQKLVVAWVGDIEVEGMNLYVVHTVIKILLVYSYIVFNINSWFPPELEGIFQSGNFDKTGKAGEFYSNTGKYGI